MGDRALALEPALVSAVADLSRRLGEGESRRDAFAEEMETGRPTRFNDLLRQFNQRERELEAAYLQKSVTADNLLRVHQERCDAQLQQHANIIGSYSDDVPRAQETALALASVFSGAKADGRSINKSRTSFEEILQSARAEHERFSALREEAQAAWSAMSTSAADIDHLLADARAARDLARLEAAESSRIARAARLNFDAFRSEVLATVRVDAFRPEVLDTVRKIAEKKVQRWVETAHSATTDAHAINTTRSHFNDALQTAR